MPYCKVQPIVEFMKINELKRTMKYLMNALTLPFTYSRKLLPLLGGKSSVIRWKQILCPASSMWQHSLAVGVPKKRPYFSQNRTA